MKILITGANGYIGRRLISALLQQGYELYCCVRDKARFNQEVSHERLKIITVDFLDEKTLPALPAELDAAFYLIHSMSHTIGDFAEAEERAARNFLRLIEPTRCRQIIYLSGIVNSQQLSDHLASRLRVEQILRKGRIPVTVLRAGIVVGSGSASFEIIRDLVEKLPVMVAPRWLETRCQPIAIRDVIDFLTGVLLRESTHGRDFDIAGSEVLTYRQMLSQFAEARGLKRLIITVPVMSPRLSSYWLYFITSTSYALAANLVDSMKVDIIARDNHLAKELGITPISYRLAVELALARIERDNVISGWKDSFSSSGAKSVLMTAVNVPQHGCFRDARQRNVDGRTDIVWQRVWNIGGDTGWYYADWLWVLRGWIDKLFGGVGLNRGRTQAKDIAAGDALDFWRVLLADKKGKRLLLFAEMRLPGEAWLEFQIVSTQGGEQLIQTATFRPRGVLGRLYWYAVLPFHGFIFNGMIRKLAKG
ncbi:MAG: SDR family oxidoreductase [Verrucomicrobiota bacterium]